ncbi:hypothetical protein [Vagococcus proximus]|nr:hypothetical protein [Vagococcus proximus]
MGIIGIKFNWYRGVRDFFNNSIKYSINFLYTYFSQIVLFLVILLGRSNLENWLEAIIIILYFFLTYWGYYKNKNIRKEKHRFKLSENKFKRNQRIPNKKLKGFMTKNNLHMIAMLMIVLFIQEEFSLKDKGS